MLDFNQDNIFKFFFQADAFAGVIPNMLLYFFATFKLLTLNW